MYVMLKLTVEHTLLVINVVLARHHGYDIFERCPESGVNTPVGHICADVLNAMAPHIVNHFGYFSKYV